MFEMVVNLKPEVGTSFYKLQAIAKASSVDEDFFTVDRSTSGTNPDPSGDENPAESIVSTININVPNVILVTGEIAIVDPITSKNVNSITYCDSSPAITLRPITSNSGGLFDYTYQWEYSRDDISYSYLTGYSDSTISIKGFTDSVYIRRKVISGDQWAYSKPVLLFVNKAKKPVITASATNLEPGGTVTLTSTDAKSYVWSTAQTTKSVSVTTAGKYALSIIDNNGCKSVSDTMVIAPPAPATNKTTYILGAIDNPSTVVNAVKLTASNSSLKFYNKLTGGSLMATPTMPNTAGKFQYFVVQDVNGIESSILPVEITILDPVKVVTIEKVVSRKAELQADASFLIGFDFNLANLRGETITNIDLRDDLSKTFPSKMKVEVVSLKSTGKLNPNTLYDGYAQTGILLSTSEIAANGKDTIRLLLKVYPNGYLGDLTNIAEQTATSPFGTFKMSSYDAKVTGSTPVISGSPTKFNVPEISIIIPTGFSPNRDGQNDKYVIVRPYNITIGLEMFDRTGGVVYKSADYKNDWDGRANQRMAFFGKDLPDGTYFYIVTATDKLTNKVTKFNGYITLRR
jgi:gliding motility-associated-like protein